MLGLWHAIPKQNSKFFGGNFLGLEGGWVIWVKYFSNRLQFSPTTVPRIFQCTDRAWCRREACTEWVLWTPFWFGYEQSYTWIFLYAFILLVCVCDFFTCMYVLHSHVLSMNRPEENTESPGTRAIGHCEPPCVWWKLNPISF